MARQTQQLLKTDIVRGLIAILLLVCTCNANAQEDPEYRAEIGVGVGLVAYQGDFNGSITKGMQPFGAIMGKYRFNPRTALSLTIGAGKIKGSSENATTWYPDYQDATYYFDRTLVDTSLKFEYNFWPYGTGYEYRGARRISPFISFGLGCTYAGGGDSGSVFTGNMPVGVGVKYKIGIRVNMQLEWTMHFSMNDKLDGVADPYGIKSSGLFKNTDCYSMLQLSLTYDILAKCKTCHNDRN